MCMGEHCSPAFLCRILAGLLSAHANNSALCCNNKENVKGE